jgi:hypothetical protein
MESFRWRWKLSRQTLEPIGGILRLWLETAVHLISEACSRGLDLIAGRPRRPGGEVLLNLTASTIRAPNLAVERLGAIE